VAIKVLPESFAKDSGQMVRFEREAKLVASLNHPNIAHIYGVEETALVMELLCRLNRDAVARSILVHENDARHTLLATMGVRSLCRDEGIRSWT
jgi:serine/threonine protein kinase